MKMKIGNKGFTLVEMLIAMSIFIMFTGILISSYTGLVKSQRDANEFRGMYSEARGLFDEVIQEFRNGMVDYGNVAYRCTDVLRGPKGDIRLVSKDGQSKSKIDFDIEKGIVSLAKGKMLSGQNPTQDPAYGPVVELNSSGVRVADFRVYVYPAFDPYDPQYVRDDVYQFQPKVTISAQFEKERDGLEPYHVEFQTSISSRIYNQVYLTDPC